MLIFSGVLLLHGGAEFFELRKSGIPLPTEIRAWSPGSPREFKIALPTWHFWFYEGTYIPVCIPANIYAFPAFACDCINTTSRSPSCCAGCIKHRDTRLFLRSSISRTHMFLPRNDTCHRYASFTFYPRIPGVTTPGLRYENPCKYSFRCIWKQTLSLKGMSK